MNLTTICSCSIVQHVYVHLYHAKLFSKVIMPLFSLSLLIIRVSCFSVSHTVFQQEMGRQGCSFQWPCLLCPSPLSWISPTHSWLTVISSGSHPHLLALLKALTALWVSYLQHRSPLKFIFVHVIIWSMSVFSSLDCQLHKRGHFAPLHLHHLENSSW